MTSAKPGAPTLTPGDVTAAEQAIASAFPHGRVGPVPDPETSYFSSLREPLMRDLSGLEGSTVLVYQAPISDPVPDDPFDPSGRPRSYCLYFVRLVGAGYELEVSATGLGDAGDEVVDRQRVGYLGCTVVVSTVAPFAVVRPDVAVRYGDGSEVDLDIRGLEPSADHDRPIDLAERFGEVVDDEIVRDLEALRGRIVQVLSRHGVAVLGEDEAKRQVPDLALARGIWAGEPGRPITVFDALFFSGPTTVLDDPPVEDAPGPDGPLYVYWCTTDDNDEDWFVVAESAEEAALFHEEQEGYDPGEADAELVCEVPADVHAQVGWPSKELLEQLGFEYLEADGVRVVRYQDRLFREGDIVTNAAVRLSVRGQEPS